MAAPIRFIHCSDLHLGSRFVGLSDSSPELAKRMARSTYQALDNIVSKANNEEVDFVVFSGDVFDSVQATPYARKYFRDSLEKIGVPCYIAYGNHDYERMWELSIPLPENAYVFGNVPTRFTYPPNSNDPLVEIIGVSYAEQAVHKNLCAEIKGDPKLFTIGVVHCEVNGAPDSNYAPTKLNELMYRAVDYWALGHVHNEAVLATDPYVVYPGNTQGRNPSESGPKGAYLVTILDMKVFRMEFFETHEVLWQDIDIVIDSDMDLSDFIDEVQGKLMADALVRIRVTGSGPLNNELRLNYYSIRDMIVESTGCVCTGLVVDTKPDFDLSERAKVGDFISAIIDSGTRIASMSASEIIDTICTTHASASLRDDFENMDLEELRQLATEAMELVVERMIGGE